VGPLIRTKEPELLDKIGLDAVAYLRFNRLLRWLFSSIALVTCAILIPINVTYNLKEVKPGDRDILTMLTIRDVRGNLLFVHVAVSYLVTILVCVFVWFHWKAMVSLRRQWFKSPEYLESFYARTLTCMHVPKKYQSDQGEASPPLLASSHHI
jgi:calcium permeable stress-gated cation channel